MSTQGSQGQIQVQSQFQVQVQAQVQVQLYCQMHCMWGGEGRLVEFHDYLLEALHDDGSYRNWPGVIDAG